MDTDVEMSSAEVGETQQKQQQNVATATPSSLEGRAAVIVLETNLKPGDAAVTVKTETPSGPMEVDPHPDNLAPKSPNQPANVTDSSKYPKVSVKQTFSHFPLLCKRLLLLFLLLTEILNVVVYCI